MNETPAHLSRARLALTSHLPRTPSQILFAVGAFLLISCAFALAYAALWFRVASIFGTGGQAHAIIEGFLPPKSVTYEVECEADNCGGTSFWHMDKHGSVESFVPTQMNYRTSSWSTTLSWYVSPKSGVYPRGRSTCRIFVDGNLRKEHDC